MLYAYYNSHWGLWQEMKIFLMNVGLSLIIKVMSGVWVLTKDGHIIISFEAVA